MAWASVCWTTKPRSGKSGRDLLPDGSDAASPGHRKDQMVQVSYASRWWKAPYHPICHPSPLTSCGNWGSLQPPDRRGRGCLGSLISLLSLLVMAKDAAPNSPIQDGPEKRGEGKCSHWAGFWEVPLLIDCVWTEKWDKVRISRHVGVGADQTGKFGRSGWGGFGKRQGDVPIKVHRLQVLVLTAVLRSD